MVTTVADAPRLLERARLDDLIGLLARDGRRVIGPVVRDGAIVTDEIHAAADLPIGYRDAQAAGDYRLEHRSDDRVFAFNAGQTGWKPVAFPARVPVGTAATNGSAVAFRPVHPPAAPVALLGVRACDLAAIAIQDRVLRDGPVADPDYAARRRDVLVVAVECTTSASTCFCTSMGSGPEIATDAADVTLTEVEGGFVVRAGSSAGRALVAELDTQPASPGAVTEARAAVGAVRAAIGDPMQVDGLPGRLKARPDHPQWAAIAERCLSCANCTLVCPTCFCTGLSQTTDLAGTSATTTRSWDSCFSGDFAKVAGGNFRSRPQDRYRQWLTHKFGTWVDQFGTFGCVGCGRCIAWCPAGIDVREELDIIAGRPGRPPLPVVAGQPGEFTAGTVVTTAAETADTTTLVVDVKPGIAAGEPGQFVMVTRPGLPAVPISVSRYHPDAPRLELSIRAAGPATAQLSALRPGEAMGVRGPLGRGWPVPSEPGRDVVVVAGGIGLSPLRPLLDRLVADRARHGAIRLYYGARTPLDRVHVEDLRAWATRDIDVQVTVDRAGEAWQGPVGVVTHLFDKSAWEGREVDAYVCGPERMMQAAVTTLQDRGVRADCLHVSLERHMDCGIGLCGHCQMGGFFVCRDGPVFTLAELGDTFWQEGA